jgi:hypothetical protein
VTCRRPAFGFRLSHPGFSSVSPVRSKLPGLFALLISVRCRATFASASRISLPVADGFNIRKYSELSREFFSICAIVSKLLQYECFTECDFLRAILFFRIRCDIFRVPYQRNGEPLNGWTNECPTGEAEDFCRKCFPTGERCALDSERQHVMESELAES